MSSLKTALKIALRPEVVKRSLMFAVIVGSLLVAINHGSTIVAGEMDWNCALRCGLTAFVPYCVSTITSVMAEMNR